METPYQVRPSPIDGMGLFATRRLRKGEVLVLPNHPPQGCEGFNHSCDPNLSFRLDDNNTRQVVRDIAEGEELTASYLNVCQCEYCINQPPVACKCPMCKGK
jgi:SET domain-containing protein